MENLPADAKAFIYAASAPSFAMMGKGHLVETAPVMVTGRQAEWDLPTVAEMMSPDYKPRNVHYDGSWITA